MKAITLAVVLLALCSCSENLDVCPEKNLSAANYYSDQSCWVSHQGDLRALIALTETASGYTPTFISLVCRNIELGNTELLSLAEYRTPILFDGGVDEKAATTVLSKPIISNYVTPRPPLSRTDRVFYAIAKADLESLSSENQIKVSDFKELSDTGMSLGQILDTRHACLE
ncbi:MAG: hypothetical protein AAF707_00765 [Pseudomonadota bacterium]